MRSTSRVSTLTAVALSPLRVVASVADAALHRQAERKEHDHFEEREEGIDGEPCERVGMREARDPVVNALADHGVERQVLAQDQRKRGSENYDGAGDVAEDRLLLEPRRQREEKADERDDCRLH